MTTNGELLLKKLQLLEEHGGFIVFAIDEYYIQFYKDDDTGELDFEAVSHNFLDTLSTDLAADFERLGFKISEENYSKKIYPEKFAEVVEDAAFIFSNIYLVDYTKPFEVTDEISY